MTRRACVLLQEVLVVEKFDGKIITQVGAPFIRHCYRRCYLASLGPREPRINRPEHNGSCPWLCQLISSSPLHVVVNTQEAPYITPCAQCQ